MERIPMASHDAAGTENYTASGARTNDSLTQVCCVFMPHDIALAVLLADAVSSHIGDSFKKVSPPNKDDVWEILQLCLMTQPPTRTRNVITEVDALTEAIIRNWTMLASEVLSVHSHPSSRVPSLIEQCAHHAETTSTRAKASTDSITTSNRKHPLEEPETPSCVVEKRARPVATGEEPCMLPRVTIPSHVPTTPPVVHGTTLQSSSASVATHASACLALENVPPESFSVRFLDHFFTSSFGAVVAVYLHPRHSSSAASERRAALRFQHPATLQAVWKKYKEDPWSLLNSHGTVQPSPCTAEEVAHLLSPHTSYFTNAGVRRIRSAIDCAKSLLDSKERSLEVLMQKQRAEDHFTATSHVQEAGDAVRPSITKHHQELVELMKDLVEMQKDLDEAIRKTQEVYSTNRTWVNPQLHGNK